MRSLEAYTIAVVVHGREKVDRFEKGKEEGYQVKKRNNKKTEQPIDTFMRALFELGGTCMNSDEATPLPFIILIIALVPLQLVSLLEPLVSLKELLVSIFCNVTRIFDGLDTQHKSLPEPEATFQVGFDLTARGEDRFRFREGFLRGRII